MATFTITLADELTIVSRNIECRVAVASLSPETVALLAAHGLNQKIADAASGAAALAVKDKFGDKMKPSASEAKLWLQKPEATKAVAVHTEALMTKAAEALLRGEWSQRGAGPVDESTLVARIVAKAALKAKLGGESEAWKDFLALDTSSANERLDGIWAKNAEKLAPAHAAELEARALRRNKPKVDIDL